jgi:hypothetical protein
MLRPSDGPEFITQGNTRGAIRQRQKMYNARVAAEEQADAMNSADGGGSLEDGRHNLAERRKRVARRLLEAARGLGYVPHSFDDSRNRKVVGRATIGHSMFRGDLTHKFSDIKYLLTLAPGEKREVFGLLRYATNPSCPKRALSKLWPSQINLSTLPKAGLIEYGTGTGGKDTGYGDLPLRRLRMAIGMLDKPARKSYVPLLEAWIKDTEERAKGLNVEAADVVLEKYGGERQRSDLVVDVGGDPDEKTASEIGSFGVETASETSSSEGDTASEVGSSEADTASEVGSSEGDAASEVGSSGGDTASEVGSSEGDTASEYTGSDTSSPYTGRAGFHGTSTGTTGSTGWDEDGPSPKFGVGA